MKIATHVLLFGQEKWVMRNIENAYPHVDRIYISYSEYPWSYNSNARLMYRNNVDTNFFLDSKFADKITLIEGVWDTEEQQRNTCVDVAINDEMDILIIHDADEFYHHNEFQAVIEEIKSNPDFDHYTIPWICFWKSFEYCLLDSQGSHITGYPEFAINLNRGIKFESKRRPTSKTSLQLMSATCYHGSYVLSDEEVLRKINTWGHANDFNRNYWYNEVWLKWTPEMKNMHLVSPNAWSCAVEYNGKLPEVINDFKL